MYLNFNKRILDGMMEGRDTKDCVVNDSLKRGRLCSRTHPDLKGLSGTGRLLAVAIVM